MKLDPYHPSRTCSACALRAISELEAQHENAGMVYEAMEAYRTREARRKLWRGYRDTAIRFVVTVAILFGIYAMVVR